MNLEPWRRPVGYSDPGARRDLFADLPQGPRALAGVIQGENLALPTGRFESRANDIVEKAVCELPAAKKETFLSFEGGIEIVAEPNRRHVGAPFIRGVADLLHLVGLPEREERIVSPTLHGSRAQYGAPLVQRRTQRHHLFPRPEVHRR